MHITEEGGITTFIFLQIGGGFRLTSVDGGKAAQLTACPASLDVWVRVSASAANDQWLQSPVTKLQGPDASFWILKGPVLTSPQTPYTKNNMNL